MPKKKTEEVRSNVRSRKPKSHAEGKPMRGIRPGVRGPAKKPDEILAEQMGKDRVIIIPSIPRPAELTAQNNQHLIHAHGRVPPSGDRNRNRKLNRQLQDLIREIGNEVASEQTGWTRIVAVIRRLYADATLGKTAATALLLERGWGKVPTPIQMDMKAEVLQIMESTGLTRDEINSDPILKELMSNAIEAEFRDERSEPTGERSDKADAGTVRPPQ